MLYSYLTIADFFLHSIMGHGEEVGCIPRFCEELFGRVESCIGDKVSLNSLWPSDAIWREIWVNIGSGNGLLPNGTKPLPEPMLTYNQWDSPGRNFMRDVPTILTKTSLKFPRGQWVKQSLVPL